MHLHDEAGVKIVVTSEAILAHLSGQQCKLLIDASLLIAGPDRGSVRVYSTKLSGIPALNGGV